MLQPPATLILGASGSGKSSSLVTAIPAGLELFVVCTEPGGPESLLDWCRQIKADVNKLHWTSVLPATQGWTGLESMARQISAMDFESLSKIKSGIGKDATRPAATKLLGAFANFHCERTNKDFGDVTTWGPNRMLALDSLSGLSVISWALTVGHKPTAHMGEWNIAMNFIRDLLMKLTTDRSCYFTLTAHIEKETNEITGVQQIMASTLGRKLAPTIPRFFSEVVYAQRTMAEPRFRWSTIDSQVELKNRGLPLSDKLPQDFRLIVDAYNARLKDLGMAQQPSSLAPPSAA